MGLCIVRIKGLVYYRYDEKESDPTNGRGNPIFKSSGRGELWKKVKGRAALVSSADRDKLWLYRPTGPRKDKTAL